MNNSWEYPQTAHHKRRAKTRRTFHTPDWFMQCGLQLFSGGVNHLEQPRTHARTHTHTHTRTNKQGMCVRANCRVGVGQGASVTVRVWVSLQACRQFFLLYTLPVYYNPGNFRKRLIFVLFVNSWNLLKSIALIYILFKFSGLKCTVKRSNLWN